MIGHVFPELWTAKVVIYTTLNLGWCLLDDIDSGTSPLWGTICVKTQVEKTFKGPYPLFIGKQLLIYILSL